jgi:hypothetical protein
VILDGEAGLGIHSHLREAGLSWLWRIQGAISATLTVVEIQDNNKRAPLMNGVLMTGHFIR